jgi:hypothetical protein
MDHGTTATTLYQIIYQLGEMNFENAGNPVICALVSGSEGKGIIGAMVFLKTVQDFENDQNVKS